MTNNPDETSDASTSFMSVVCVSEELLAQKMAKRDLEWVHRQKTP